MRKMRRSRKARRTMVDCRPGTRIARYVGSIASRSMMPKTLFMYRVGRRTATMRAVYSTVKRAVKNHSACIKKTPYTACRDSTLSSITISTLVTMLHSKTSSKSLPARVSDSKMTLWSFPRQPPSGPCASCCIPLEDPVIPDMIADASGNAHILDDHRLRGPVTLIGGTPLYRHHYLEPRDDFAENRVFPIQ